VSGVETILINSQANKYLGGRINSRRELLELWLDSDSVLRHRIAGYFAIATVFSKLFSSCRVFLLHFPAGLISKFLSPTFLQINQVDCSTLHRIFPNMASKWTEWSITWPVTPAFRNLLPLPPCTCGIVSFWAYFINLYIWLKKRTLINSVRHRQNKTAWNTSTTQ